MQALDVVKSIVGYIRDSPKREAAFDSFIRIEDMEAAHSLRPLCITRWVCRKGALDAFCENYNGDLQWSSLLVIEGTEGKQRREALSYVKIMRFSKYYSIRLLQKLFHLCHYTHVKALYLILYCSSAHDHTT